MKTDVLVIGSGIAGLSFALKIARELPRSKITVICKGQAGDTNTQLAQGGIAAVTDLNCDSIEQHINDTLNAGAGQCDKKIARMVVCEGPARIIDLINEGLRFDRKKNNTLDLAKEGGHSTHRVLHRGDHTGMEIQNTLLKKVLECKNMRVLQEMIATDLLIARKDKSRTNNTICLGAKVWNKKTGRIVQIKSLVTLLAGGGLGQVYAHTTNSEGACGDGIAMAYRAGAKIKHMAYVQFHPTALYGENTGRSFLISEAVRGAGAILKDHKGRAFMKHYDMRKDLATRDIVSRAIRSEMKRCGNTHVFLDCRMIPEKYFRSHFPGIYKKCRGMEIDPHTCMIPVVPSAHYCCGGIKTDEHARTSIQNLYACGENACTGLHGANRLASNSLLEALVFAHRAKEDVARHINTIGNISVLPEQKTTSRENRSSETEIRETIALVKTTMSSFSGISTNNKDLSTALTTIRALQKKWCSPEQTILNTTALDLRNMLDSCLLILRDAKKRRKNCGVFFNTDLEPKKKRMVPAFSGPQNTI